MILSYSSGFIFIHIEKAAGSSIQQALLPHASVPPNSRLRRRLAWFGPLNRIGGLYRAVQFQEHVTANEVKRCLPPAVYDSLFKFAFVRNPWDRLVSRYAHLLRSTDRRRHGFISKLDKFEDFLKWEIQRGSAQHPYVTAENPGGIAARECFRASRLPELLHAGNARVRGERISAGYRNVSLQF